MKPRVLRDPPSLFLAVLISAICLCSLSAQAQEAQPAQSDALAQAISAPASQARFTVSLAPTSAGIGAEVTLTIAAEVADGWHIGPVAPQADERGFPTQIRFLPVGLEPIDGAFQCSAEPRTLPLAVGTQRCLEGRFTWTRTYRVTQPAPAYAGRGFIRFQACDDTNCLPPQTLDYELRTAQSGLAAAVRWPPPFGQGVANANLAHAIGDPLHVTLETCDLTRVRPQLGNIASLLLFGRGTDTMVWKGTVPAGPHQGVSIYLPKATHYSLTNTGAGGTIANNTATYVSVDQDGNGVLSEWEACGADRPIRIHDSMYRITAIDADNATLTLQALDMPLRGSLIGFRCPDFEFTTVDGSTISNKSILGKTTVLDIWAVTCHNCYEGFPNLQRSLDKHTSDTLRVVLLTVDTNRQLYDSRAPRLFETYGGADWPQIMIPGGFDGALVIGDYGFGSVVVDKAGIVRGVGVHGHDIETVLADTINRPGAAIR